MKSIHTHLLRTLLAAVFVTGDAGVASAHYDHDQKGWYDEHHHRHDYISHNGHRGYWDHNNSGARIFIRI